MLSIHGSLSAEGSLIPQAIHIKQKLFRVVVPQGSFKYDNENAQQSDFFERFISMSKGPRPKHQGYSLFLENQFRSPPPSLIDSTGRRLHTNAMFCPPNTQANFFYGASTEYAALIESCFHHATAVAKLRSTQSFKLEPVNRLIFAVDFDDARTLDARGYTKIREPKNYLASWDFSKQHLGPSSGGDPHYASVVYKSELHSSECVATSNIQTLSPKILLEKNLTITHNLSRFSKNGHKETLSFAINFPNFGERKLITFDQSHDTQPSPRLDRPTSI